MSLLIDIATVTAVLLADGRWYEIENQSFVLDSYEYHWAEEEGRTSNARAFGFEFKTAEGEFICGPFSTIHAVRRDLTPKGRRVKAT